MVNDEYMDVLAGNTCSTIQDFESYLRTEIGLVGSGVRLVLDEYNSTFITYELEPSIYNFKDVSEVLSRFFQSEYEGNPNVIDYKIDEFSMKNKLNVRPRFIAIRLDEKSFFSSIFGFNHSWVYKHYNEYISQKKYKFRYHK